MVRRLIVLSLLCVSTAYAVSLKDLVARLSENVSAPIMYGTSVNLDGSNEWMDQRALYLLDGASSYSISAWVYSMGLNTNYPGIYTARGTLLNGLSITPQTNGACPVFYAGGRNSYSTTALPTNTWVHLVGIAVMSNAPKLYVNGVIADIVGTNIQTSFFNDGYWTIGSESRNNYTDREFKGLIDECVLWKNRVLTTNEIAELATGVKVETNKNFSSTGVSMNTGLLRLNHLDGTGSDSNIVDSKSGTLWTGHQIGSGDWTNGIVPQ